MRLARCRSGELVLSEDMARWWSTLGATLDPNGAAAPEWTSYAPGHEDGAMFMDSTRMSMSLALRVRYMYSLNIWV